MLSRCGTFFCTCSVLALQIGTLEVIDRMRRECGGMYFGEKTKLARVLQVH